MNGLHLLLLIIILGSIFYDKNKHNFKSKHIQFQILGYTIIIGRF